MPISLKLQARKHMQKLGLTKLLATPLTLVKRVAVFQRPNAPVTSAQPVRRRRPVLPLRDVKHLTVARQIAARMMPPHAEAWLLPQESHASMVSTMRWILGLRRQLRQPRTHSTG